MASLQNADQAVGGGAERRAEASLAEGLGLDEKKIRGVVMNNKQVKKCVVHVGGQSRSTGDQARQPKWAWVESLFWQARKGGAKVYWKPNLEVRPKEMPI